MKTHAFGSATISNAPLFSLAPGFWLLIIVLLGLMLRLAATQLLAEETANDAPSYLAMAASLAETGHMRDDFGNVAFYSAGYPIVLAIFFVVFGSHLETVTIVNILLGCVSIWLVYLCAKEVVSDRRWALIAAFVWASYPPAIIYTEYANKEALVVPLLLLQCLLLLRFLRSSNRLLLSAGLGAVCALNILTAAATLPMALVILIAIMMSGNGNAAWRKRLWYLAVAVIGLAVTLGPWLMYSQQELGAPVIATNRGFNLYLGNNANQDSPYFRSISDTPIGSRGWNELRRQVGEVAASQQLEKAAIQHILQHPWKSLKLSARKLAAFWMPPVHAGQGGNRSSLEAAARAAWLLYYVAIVALAVLPLAMHRCWRAARARITLLYALVIAYWSVHGIIYVIFRYRLPVMALMTVLGAAGLCILADAVVRRSHAGLNQECRACAQPESPS